MRTRPVLLFDGDCGFCTSAVDVLQRVVRPRCTAVPWQRADLAALGVAEERARHEVLWVTPAGTVYGGVRTVAKLLLSAGGPWPVVGGALMVPPVRWVAHVGYRFVADHRGSLPGGTPACARPDGGTRHA
ncbi:thiol-disulfide oxidoreductase DCC family protein [Streptomyces sp. NPDC059786]|uniref:thiol-disulfide oxidoreductase DCC family protein n=1 Tax=Streptomyces sp. NPDC059786 TaxID=3346946 RepID=UPI00364CDE88